MGDSDFEDEDAWMEQELAKLEAALDQTVKIQGNPFKHEGYDVEKRLVMYLLDIYEKRGEVDPVSTMLMEPIYISREDLHLLDYPVVCILDPSVKMDDEDVGRYVGTFCVREDDAYTEFFPIYVNQFGEYFLDHKQASIADIYLRLCEYSDDFRERSIGAVESDAALMTEFMRGEIKNRHVPKRSVSKEVIEMRQSGELTDIGLKFDDGRTIRAHRVVLAAASDFFKSMCTSSVKPVVDEAGNVLLQHVASSDFELMLDYMYGGVVDISKHNNLPELARLADYFRIPELVTYLRISDNTI